MLSPQEIRSLYYALGTIEAELVHIESLLQEKVIPSTSLHYTELVERMEYFRKKTVTILESHLDPPRSPT